MPGGERLGFGQVMVSGGPAGGPAAEAVPDVLPGAGPMGGIYSCLAAARYSKNLVLPVDVPQFPDRWALRLLHLARESGADVTVLSLQGRQEPLLSVWDAGCCPVLRSLLERGERKVSSAFALLRVAELDYAEEPFWIGNINTPEDYEKFLGGKAAPGIGGEEAGAFEETEQIS